MLSTVDLQMADLSEIFRINTVKILKGVGGGVGNSSKHNSWWHCYYTYIIFYRDVTQLEIHLDS